jgi:hypothetical protein
MEATDDTAENEVISADKEDLEIGVSSNENI